MTHNREEIPDPVSPGTILHRIEPDREWTPRIPAEMGNVTIHATVPARIHLSVLDMTRFSPGNPGGGGVGYAIGMFARAEVSVRDVGRSEDGEDITIRVNARRSSLVEHITRVFLGHLGLSGTIEVMGAGHEINHMGLGSTSALVSSVALSLNRAFGEPYSLDGIRRLIGFNFVEEWENGLVIPGFETGVAPFVGIHGGFGVVSDTLNPVAHFPFQDQHEVVIALIEEEMSDTLVESKNAGISETELLMNRARALDERDRDRKAYEVLMRLIPACYCGNLGSVGESIRRLQRMGSKVAEIEHHTRAREIYETIDLMGDHGSLVTGMSSVGPAIAAILPVTGEGRGAKGGCRDAEGKQRGSGNEWADGIARVIGNERTDGNVGDPERCRRERDHEAGSELVDVLRDHGYRVIVTKPDNTGLRLEVVDRE